MDSISYVFTISDNLPDPHPVIYFQRFMLSSGQGELERMLYNYSLGSGEFEYFDCIFTQRLFGKMSPPPIFEKMPLDVSYKGNFPKKINKVSHEVDFIVVDFFFSNCAY